MKSDVEVNEDQPRGDRQFVRARRTPIFLIAEARGQAGGEDYSKTWKGFRGASDWGLVARGRWWQARWRLGGPA